MDYKRIILTNRLVLDNRIGCVFIFLDEGTFACTNLSDDDLSILIEKLHFCDFDVIGNHIEIYYFKEQFSFAFVGTHYQCNSYMLV